MTALRAEDVRALVLGGAMLLAAAIGIRLLEWVFASREIVAVAISAFVLDWWSQKIGARWLPSPVPRPPGLANKRLLQGLALGLAIGLVVVGTAAIAGAARVSIAHMSATSLAIGAVRTSAYAFRDELLFRGVPLALADGHVPRAWSIAFSVALGVAPLVLSNGVEPMVLGAAAALFFALTWQVGPGGLFAWAAHVGWRVAIEVIGQGAVFDVEWKSGTLSSATTAAGLPAYLDTAALGLAAFILYRRKPSSPQ